jgi:hypothetical protein
MRAGYLTAERDRTRILAFRAGRFLSPLEKMPDQLGCEARKIPAAGDVFSLDFYLYRTYRGLPSKVLSALRCRDQMLRFGLANTLRPLRKTHVSLIHNSAFPIKSLDLRRSVRSLFRLNFASVSMSTLV